MSSTKEDLLAIYESKAAQVLPPITRELAGASLHGGHGAGSDRDGGAGNRERHPDQLELVGRSEEVWRRYSNREAAPRSSCGDQRDCATYAAIRMS